FLGLPFESPLEPLILVDQNPPDVVASRIGRIECLAGKKIDDSIVEMHLTAKGQVEEFLCCSWTSPFHERIVFLNWKQTLVLYDSIGVSKVADEINDQT